MVKQDGDQNRNVRVTYATKRSFRARNRYFLQKNTAPEGAVISCIYRHLLTLQSPCHANIVVDTELIKPLGYRRKAIGVDLQFKLSIIIQWDIQGIVSSAVTGKHVLTIRQRHGTNRGLAVLQQHLARYFDALGSRNGPVGRTGHRIEVGACT